MGENETVNMHLQAIKFRSELQGVFSSIDGIEPWNVIGKFTDFLEKSGCKIDNTTVYKYINETIFPAWLLPYLFEFLSQEPYCKSQAVRNFMQPIMSPMDLARERIRQQAEKEKKRLLDRAKELDRYL